MLSLSEQALATDVMVELAGQINGRVRLTFSPESPQALTDYGGIVYKQSAIIVRPTHTADISATFQFARKHRLPVSIRGAGHSCKGQSLCEGGITLLNTRNEASFRLLGDHRVEAATGTSWGQLSTALSQKNLSPRVSTSHPGVTIGGTLSAGGYGLQSVVYGGQIDQVERLYLIKPDGEAVWCSPTENAQLFAYSLGGLGQIGFIEKVVMRVRPQPAPIRWLLYKQESIDEVVASMAWLEDLPNNAIHGFSAVYLFGKHAFSLYGVEEPHVTEFVKRLPYPLRHKHYHRIGEPPQFRDNASTAVHQQPFCPAVDYLFAYDQLAGFLNKVNTLWDQYELKACAPTCLLHAIRPSQSHLHPFAATNFGDPNSLKYLVGIYPVIPPDAPEVLAQVRQALRLLLQACVAANGRPYLYGWHELNHDMKQNLYGESYKVWQALCRQLDPDGILKRSL